MGITGPSQVHPNHPDILELFSCQLSQAPTIETVEIVFNVPGSISLDNWTFLVHSGMQGSSACHSAHMPSLC